MWGAGLGAEAWDTWTPLLSKGLPARGWWGPGKGWQSNGSCGTRHAASLLISTLGWQRRKGWVPLSLGTLEAPGQAAGLGSEQSQRRVLPFSWGTLSRPRTGPRPLPALPSCRLPLPSQHPRSPHRRRARPAEGGCAGPALLPALISLWKSQSLVEIQLWFWGQPSLALSRSLSLFPLPSFCSPSSSSPSLISVLSGGSGYRCSITSYLHPGGWERGAEGEGCGGQAE